MKRLFLAAAGLMACASVTPAAAVPLSPTSPAADVPSLVAQAQGYHKNCIWVNNGWGYHSGGKVLVCRPYRPHGTGWSWHKEGNKHGWYHAKRKSWHHKW